MYLAFDEYKQMNGIVDEYIFPILEMEARLKLDYWTQNRITEDTIDEKIKFCMFKIIEVLNENNTGTGDIASYSNDGVSVSYADAKTSDEKLNNVYRFCVQVLPLELISLCI